MRSISASSHATQWGRAASVVRWIVFVPSGLLATLVASFPAHWFVLFLHSSTSTDESWFSWEDISAERLEAWVMGLVLPFVFIVAGTKVAPRGKTYVAGALALAWLLVYTAGLAVLLTYINTTVSDDFAFSRWDYVQVASVAGLNLAGAILGFFYVLNEWGNEHV